MRCFWAGLLLSAHLEDGQPVLRQPVAQRQGLAGHRHDLGGGKERGGEEVWRWDEGGGSFALAS